MAAERKKLKSLPKEERTCKFYPSHCNTKGHVDSRNCNYGMYKKLKEEKDAAMAAIEQALVESEAKRVGAEMQGAFLYVLYFILLMVQMFIYFYFTYVKYFVLFF